MQQFFIDEKLDPSQEYCLPDDICYQVTKVLRYRGEELVRIVDSSGRLFLCRLRMEKKAVYAGVLEELFEEKEIYPPIYIALARIKKDRWEWALQKLTELGVAGIVPIRTTRVNEKDINEHQFTRQKKIIKEAGEQAERTSLPELYKEMGLNDALEKFDLFQKILLTERKKDIPQLTEEKIIIDRNAEGVLLFIGPEGGFSQEEKKSIIAGGAKEASLGSNVLRAETAALAAAAIIASRMSC